MKNLGAELCKLFGSALSLDLPPRTEDAFAALGTSPTVDSPQPCALILVLPTNSPAFDISPPLSSGRKNYPIDRAWLSPTVIAGSLAWGARCKAIPKINNINKLPVLKMVYKVG